mgnify:CR=1 FL=1
MKLIGGCGCFGHLINSIENRLQPLDIVLYLLKLCFQHFRAVCAANETLKRARFFVERSAQSLTAAKKDRDQPMGKGFDFALKSGGNQRRKERFKGPCCTDPTLLLEYSFPNLLDIVDAV